jgi:hypothetical protein
MYKINQVFDSARYFGFDVNMRYKTDTVFGKFETDEIKGTYIINNKQLYYQLDDNTYMQNDSISIMVMPEDKQVIVSKTIISDYGNLFPVKNFTDSLLDSTAAYYSILTDSSGNFKTIRFEILNDSLPAPYTSLSVIYDKETYFITKIILKSKLQSDDLMLIRPINPYFQSTIEMNFTNYRVVNNAPEMDQTAYLFYNARVNKFSLAPKYEDYQLVLLGFEELNEGN